MFKRAQASFNLLSINKVEKLMCQMSTHELDVTTMVQLTYKID